MKENGWKQEKKGGKEEGDQERVHIALSVKFSLSIWKKSLELVLCITKIVIAFFQIGNRIDFIVD